LGTQEKNKKAFDYLYKYKDQIESKFGEKLEWERRDNNVTSEIKIQINEVDVSKKED
jgi:hypothetical protein